MKYMGSKAKIAKYILPIILNGRKDGQYYVEPFCGGCNLIDKVENPRIASDKNAYLIAMWKALQEGKEFPKKIDREFYNDVRDSYNNIDSRYSTDEIGWVGYMGSFNGRFFDGGYSGHNVKGRDYIGENIRNTLQQVPKLSGVQFLWSEYNELKLWEKVPPKSIIYLDPPYKGTKQYSSNKYFDHDKFWNWCRALGDFGHSVFISEYQAPEDFIPIWQMQVTNSMNQTITKKPIEKLFVHKSQADKYK